MSSFLQMLGIEKGNPIGIFLVIVTSLAVLGWWAFYFPQGQASKKLVEFRKEMLLWQERETLRHEALWREKVELMKRLEAAEGKLARWKAQYQIKDDGPSSGPGTGSGG